MSDNPFKKLSEDGNKNFSDQEKKIDEQKKSSEQVENLSNQEEKKSGGDEKNNNSEIFSKQIPVAPEKKSKKKFSFLGFIIGVLILGLFSSVLLIFILIVGGPGNPLLDLLGIQAAQIQSSLLTLTQTIFSVFSLSIFAIGTIFLFLGILAKSDKNKYFITSGIFGGLLFLTVIIWLGLYNYINGFNFGLKIKADIEVSLEDGSKDLSKVKTPAILNFSISKGVSNEEMSGKSVVSIYWDFNNDGIFDYKGIEETISHEFNTPGNKKIVAVLNFKDGTNQSYERIFTIKDGSFGTDVQSGTAPLKVTFNTENIVNNSKNKITEFRWYFDGGENPDLITSSIVVEHIFKKVGKYNVVLVAVDSKSNIKKYTKQITVLDGNGSSNLVANMTIFPGTKGEAPFKVKFSGEKSFSKKGKITSYSWDFGEFEKNFNGKDVVKTFEKPGTYQVKFTVENEYGDKNSVVKTILVTGKDAKPVAKISTNLEKPEKGDVYQFELPFLVKFDGSESSDKNNDIVKYSWDFDGNGVFDAFGEYVEKKIMQPGFYKVKLTIEDSKGNIGESFMDIEGIDPVKALIKTDKDSGVAPLVVLFDASSSRVNLGDKIVNYSWDFGNGSVSKYSSAQKKHRFENPGEYNVILKIFTEQGKTFTSTKRIFVREQSVQSCFTVSKSQTNIDSEIKFSSQCSLGEIKDWYWDFGDGKISYQRNPVHSYSYEGKYTVVLQVIDYKNNVSDFRKTIEIK